MNDPQPKEVGEGRAYRDRNPSYIFLRTVEEKESIKFKNKTSTEWNKMYMTIVNKVIDGIGNPLTYICNLSFKTISR